MRRGEGGREGEVIPRVWESTVAAEGMFGNLNPLGDGPGRSLADHGARVPEVLPAAELEGFLTGLTIAMPREPVFGAAVGDGMIFDLGGVGQRLLTADTRITKVVRTVRDCCLSSRERCTAPDAG